MTLPSEIKEGKVAVDGEHIVEIEKDSYGWRCGPKSWDEHEGITAQLVAIILGWAEPVAALQGDEGKP